MKDEWYDRIQKRHGWMDRMKIMKTIMIMMMIMVATMTKMTIKMTMSTIEVRSSVRMDDRRSYLDQKVVELQRLS